MPDHPSIEQLERRVKADPLSIAFAALAEEYRRAGRYAEAIEVCRTGLARHPAYISARVTLGRALFAIGQLAEATEELEGVLRAAPENLAAIRALAEIHQQGGVTRGAGERHPKVSESAGPAAAARDGAPSAETKREEPREAAATHRQEQEEDAHAVEATPAHTRPPDASSREQIVLRELQRFLDGALILKRDRAAGHVLR